LIEFCGLRLAHRVINGSGTFDAIAARHAFGPALARDFPFAAYVSKTITLQSQAGNPSPRLWEAPSGLINSIGLPNKGVDAYIEEDLPRLAELLADAGEGGDAGSDSTPVPLITNVMGSSAEEFAALVERCERHAEIAAIELNVSCPNVKTGLDIGADAAQLEQVVRACRPRTRKPLIVKLTPNTADVPACAQGAEAGGADAVSLINTLRAMALAPQPRGSDSGARAARSPWLGGATGGDPRRRSRAGLCSGGTRERAGDRHGWSSAGVARARSAGRRRDARRGRHRELPRSDDRERDRRESVAVTMHRRSLRSTNHLLDGYSSATSERFPALWRYSKSAGKDASYHSQGSMRLDLKLSFR